MTSPPSLMTGQACRIDPKKKDFFFFFLFLFCRPGIGPIISRRAAHQFSFNISTRTFKSSSAIDRARRRRRSRSYRSCAVYLVWYFLCRERKRKKKHENIQRFRTTSFRGGGVNGPLISTTFSLLLHLFICPLHASRRRRRRR